jgi:hypothetical protein
MNLQTTIQNIAHQHHVNVEQKSIYALQKFINELHVTPEPAHDFHVMVDKIKESYRLKSFKSEMFFIQHVAHTTNKESAEPIIDFKSLDLSKNFKSTICEQSLHYCNNTLRDTSATEHELVHALNNLERYTHKGNTQFIEEMDAKYAFKKLAKVKYIDYKNRDKTPAMLTFTLDKEYRKYIRKGDAILGEFEGLEEIYKGANLEELIEKSYHKLNSIYRNFYYYLKTLNKRSAEKDKLDFIMIFEPHKSLTLHLHLLFYCNETQLVNLKRAWSNYLKDLTEEQQRAQDFTVIDRIRASSATYLSKYLIKEYNSETEEASFFNQFKRYFSKLKLFRTSNFYHTTQAKIDKMYNYLASNYPDILEKIRFSNIPIYEILEQFEVEGLFQFEKECVDALGFDRKKIKAFYEIYTPSHEPYEIKQEIIDNIDGFVKLTTHQRIKEAVFIWDNEKVNQIFDSYGINKIIDEEEYPPDKFYTSDMYIVNTMSLNKAISMAHCMMLLECDEKIAVV